MNRREVLSCIGVALPALGIVGCVEEVAIGGQEDSTRTTDSRQNGGSQGGDTSMSSTPTKLGTDVYIESGAYDRSELRFSEVSLFNVIDVESTLEGVVRNVSSESFDRVAIDVVFLSGPLGTEPLWQTRVKFSNFPSGESFGFEVPYRGDDPPTEAMSVLIRDVDTVGDQ